MAYNGKTVAIDGIVEAAFRDSGLEQIDWEAAIEWTAELLGVMGISATKKDVVTNGLGYNPSPLIVEEYRARLPEAMEVLTSARRAYVNDEGDVVGYNPMIQSTNVYHTSDAEMSTNQPSRFDPTFRATEVDSETGNPGSKDTYVEMSPLYANGSVPYSYKIDGQYIFTDFEDGYIELAYKGFPVDDRGLPLVPDDPKFIQALKYHIVFRCDWKAWRAQPASPGLKAVVNDSETRRDFYVAAARNKAHIPTVDSMEAIKNQWIRSIPKINEHANGFKTLGVQEQRYNQYAGRRNRRY